jgi:alkylhydroperoxidase family enzyme
MPARLAPLDPPHAPEVADALRRLMGGADAAPLALFRTIAHHPQLLDRFRATGSTLLSFGTLAADERETLIQRTTARCGAGYEWGVHAALFAPALGFGADWLGATWSGAAQDDAFSPRQAVLVRLADALHDDARIDDELWAELEDGWSPEQLVEAVCVCGFYHLVSFLCGAFAIEPEPWAVAPPAVAR